MAKFNYFKKKTLVKRNSSGATQNKKESFKKYLEIKEARRFFEEYIDLARKPTVYTPNPNTTHYSFEEMYRQAVIDFIKEQLYELERNNSIRFAAGIQDFSERIHDEISTELVNRNYESFTISIDEDNYHNVRLNFNGGRITQVTRMEEEPSINFEGGYTGLGSWVDVESVYG
jgi:hypothetical protein